MGCGDTPFFPKTAELEEKEWSARGWSQCLLSGDILATFRGGVDVQVLAGQAVFLPLLPIHQDTLN